MTDRPKRIRLSRAKGFRLPANAVNVARPTKWGNPFIVGIDGDRRECVHLYVMMLGYGTYITCKAHADAQLAVRRCVIAHVRDLRGKDLACWCALDGKPCHADVLLKIANADTWPVDGAEFIIPDRRSYRRGNINQVPA